MSFGGACKALVLPLVAAVDVTEYRKPDETFQDYEANSWKWYLAYILNFGLWIGAGYLAWQCNLSQTLPMRLLYTVLACLFSGLYLIYYLVYHILMGVPCP
jgi:hypothetical protein